MNSLTIRRLADDELELDDYVHGQAFERGDRSQLEERDRWRQLNLPRLATFGIWDTAGLQCTFQVVSLEIYLTPDRPSPLGYLSYVACLPAARGRGYAGAALKHALEHMRSQGQFLSYLSPFDFDFYRRYGWEWVGLNRRYRVPTRVLKPDPGTEHVRAAGPADWPAVRSVYERFARRYRGMVARDEGQWSWLLADTSRHFRYCYLYEREGAAEGYLVYDGERFNGEETALDEFLCLTPAAQQALLGLLRRHEMQTAKVSWDAPEDDGLWLRGFNREMQTRISPVDQGRVVDVAAALQAWKPAPGARGALTLGLDDPCAPWNTGAWQIEFEGGAVSVQPARESPQVRTDIQAFSQAFFGTPAVETLRAQGRLQVDDERGDLALRELLSGPPMWSCGY